MIRYHAVLEGLVPEIEEREASVFAGYRWNLWRLLSWRDKAASVAHYRLHNLIALHRNDAAAGEMARRSRRRGA